MGIVKKQSGQSVINRKKAEIADLADKEQEQAERLQMARNKYILAYPASEFSGAEKSNEAYEKCLNGTGRILSRHTKKNLKKVCIHL